MDIRWIILSLLHQYVISQNDPCTTHQTIKDMKFRTDSNTSVTQAGCGLFPPLSGPRWFRYTSTPTGEMATTCPKNSTCGAKFQIWINDSLPSFNDGERNVNVCISTDRRCCDVGNTIGVKNCNSFFVYRLGIAPSCSRFCINATATAFTTLSTTDANTAVVSISEPVTKSTTETTIRESELPTTSTIVTIIQTSTHFASKAPTTKTTTITTTQRRTEPSTTRKSTIVKHFSTRSLNTETSAETSTSVTKSIGTTEYIKSTTIDTAVTSPLTEQASGKETVSSSGNSSIIVVVGASIGSAVGLSVLALMFCVVHRLKYKKVATNPRYELRHDIQTPQGETFVHNTRFNLNSLHFESTETPRC